METKVVEKTILELADSMAAAATTFNSHGYDMFIQARNNLIDCVHDLLLNFKK